MQSPSRHLRPNPCTEISPKVIEVYKNLLPYNSVQVGIPGLVPLPVPEDSSPKVGHNFARPVLDPHSSHLTEVKIVHLFFKHRVHLNAMFPGLVKVLEHLLGASLHPKNGAIIHPVRQGRLPWVEGLGQRKLFYSSSPQDCLPGQSP